MKQAFSLWIFFFFISTSKSQPPRASSSEGSVTINNKVIRYKATVKETFLSSHDTLIASVITTSYETINTDTARPVIFLFNGGPGASSSPLHMYAFGPVRLQKQKDTTVQINNSYSLLDVADLVFIDPVGTGFTQIFNEEKAHAYLDVEGDAKMFIDIIKTWKDEHHRNGSPVFVCGESYGTIRASKIMGIAENFPVKGVLLFSAILDMSLVAPVSGNEMPYILSLPSMAAIAWYHEKINHSAKNAEDVFNEAADFSVNDYANALMKGSTLDEFQKKSIADKLSSLTGLDANFILGKNLRVTTDDFEVTLLADKNLRIGKLNGQVAKPVPKERKPYSSRDDPSLVVNTDLKKDFTGRYFTGNLKFPGTGLYKGVNFEVNGKWKWASMDAYLGYYSVLPDLEAAVKKDDQLKLLIAGGYYDLSTPLFASRYLVDHSNIPKNRVTFLSFPTGHSIFENEEGLARLSAYVRNFVSGK